MRIKGLTALMILIVFKQTNSLAAAVAVVDRLARRILLLSSIADNEETFAMGIVDCMHVMVSFHSIDRTTTKNACRIIYLFMSLWPFIRTKNGIE